MTNDEANEKFKAAMLDRVMAEGHFVQHVTAEQAGLLGEGRAYAYTVGRSMFSRPEFLVTGLGREEAEGILHAVVALDDEGPLARPAAALTGEVWALHPNGRRIDVRLMEATPVLTLGVIATFGVSIQVVQVLWPRNGSYPSVNDRWADQPIHPQGVTPFTREDPYA